MVFFPYGKFTVTRITENNRDIFIVKKGKRTVLKTRSENKAIKTAKKLDERERRKKK